MPTNHDLCASDDETTFMGSDNDTENTSMTTENNLCHHFEGPEKRLEIDFKNLDPENKPEGLRSISADKWQEMLNFAKCTILSHKCNQFFDAFVLSESSLFVYPEKVLVKTCGTTTLLNIIPKILEYGQLCNMKLSFVTFSRKNYQCPHRQIYPHTDWNAECQYLNSIFDGHAYVLGPITSEHWYLYIADYTEPDDLHPAPAPEQTLEIMMHHLDRECASHFYMKDGILPNDKHPAMDNLIPGYQTDEFNFTPCGYSMNGLSEEAYCTIHVTPEPHCSYASFETNLVLTSYTNLVKKILNIFKPGNFTITLMHEKRPIMDSDVRDTFIDQEIPGYLRRHKTISEVEGGCDITMFHYESVDFATTRRSQVKKPIKLPIAINGAHMMINSNRHIHTPQDEEMSF